MIILDIICVVILALIFGFALNAYEDFCKNNVEKISFKESLDLVELPVITFYQGKNKFNFLLDTGSNSCHINKALVDKKKIKYEKTNTSINVYGMEGNQIETPIVEVTISLNDKEYKDNFLVNDLSNAFAELKKEKGVTLHGIIGTSFFDKYKYVIDFDKYVVYSKKK